MIGLGSCGLDYLALVASFPKPDDKLRTEKMEVKIDNSSNEFFIQLDLAGLKKKPKKIKN